MSPIEIAGSYRQRADRWNGDAFPREDGIVQHRRAIAFVNAKCRAPDVGCGSSGRIIDLLQSGGFDVEGPDVSRRMIGLAQRRHPDVRFYHADICKWELPGEYDLISAWDSIRHVPLSEQDSVLRKLLRGPAPGGVCMFSMGGLAMPSERAGSSMGPPMYRTTFSGHATLTPPSESGCTCRHPKYDQYPELHLYVIAQKV